MKLEDLPLAGAYEVRKEISIRRDKAVYLVENRDGGLRILKVFHRTYKYPLYEDLARLAHLNIPQIVETRLAEDRFYVLEEYIAGRTLQDILETDGAFDAESALDIAMQLCDALMYLHNQYPSIIHRDIKPANVILTDDGVVKLLDFDIAREHKKGAGKDTEIFGTKPFAPPEQYGFAQSGQRTDFYSLGMLLTALLTNTCNPDRIKSRRIRAVVRGCTAFDPKKRIADAGRLKNRLRLCMPPAVLPRSLREIDTNLYVFPHSRLRIGRFARPVLALYGLIFLLGFIQPLPPEGSLNLPHYSLLMFTVFVNPQWTASETQYTVFFIIVFAAAYLLLSCAAFAVYDIARFYYLKALQRFYLKRNPPRRPTIPFVIASKLPMLCAMSTVSCTVIALSVPCTDMWEAYDIHGATGLAVLLCAVLSFALRCARYPKYYNKAVRCYYKGDLKKAAKLAGMSAAVRANPARAWLSEIPAAETE